MNARMPADTPTPETPQNPDLIELVRVFENFHGVITRMEREQAEVLQDLRKHVDEEKIAKIHQLLEDHS